MGGLGQTRQYPWVGLASVNTRPRPVGRAAIGLIPAQPNPLPCLHWLSELLGWALEMTEEYAVNAFSEDISKRTDVEDY